MSYAELLQENRRLYILRTLAESPAYEANDEILAAMVSGQGIACTRGQIVADLEWLAETGLVTVEDLGSGVVMGTLTERGLDVARGLIEVRGVRKPSPGMLREQRRGRCRR